MKKIFFTFKRRLIVDKWGECGNMIAAVFDRVFENVVCIRSHMRGCPPIWSFIFYVYDRTLGQVPVNGRSIENMLAFCTFTPFDFFQILCHLCGDRSDARKRDVLHSNSKFMYSVTKIQLFGYCINMYRITSMSRENWDNSIWYKKDYTIKVLKLQVK